MSSIRTFLKGTVDYAGLFPPAQLPMEPVVRNYAAYRAGPDAWMLGRLICPAARMDEFAASLDDAVPQREADGAWSVSALGRGGDDAYGFMHSLEEDIRSIRAVRERLGGRVTVEAYECRIPTMYIGPADEAGIAELVGNTAGRLCEADIGRIVPFFEIPFLGDWRRNVPAAVRAIQRHNEQPARHEEAAGSPAACVKIRTGGVKRDMTPSSEQIACLIRACRAGGVAFKATAGLHHALHHHDDTSAAVQHGFFNVLGAAILAHALDLDEASIQEVLDDENAADFRFDNGFSWRDSRASDEQIASGRDRLILSFGSCSFEEPLEDLRRLGLR